MTKKLSTILALIFGLFFLFQNSHAANPWPAGTGTDIGTNLPPDPIVYEPSGLAWQSRLGTLFVVGDSGNITEMTNDGSILHNWYYGSAFDLEGIAVANPDSNYVYVGREDNRTIYEFDLNTWQLSGKSWDLSSWMPDIPNQGLEALTYVPNGDHPYSNSASGGLFYAGHQSDGKIYVFDVNLSASGSVNFISTITPQAGTTDLSGLDFEPSTQILYAIFDSSDLLVEMQANGTVLNSYNVPGTAQEGISVQPNCPNTTTNIYLAEDATPQIFKYSNYPNYYQNCTQVIEEEERQQEEENLQDDSRITLVQALNGYTLTGQKLIIYFKNLPSNLTKDSAYWMKWTQYNKYPPKWINKENKTLKRYWRLETNLKNYVPADSTQKYKIQVTFKYNKKLYNNLKKKQSDLKKSDLILKFRTKKTEWKKLTKYWKNTKIVHVKNKRQIKVKYFTKFKKTNYYFGIGVE
ncbi:MAG: SdiA-regulated domain-containing protein [Patescibacteria group bacterium]|jgi:hypothetical protein